MMGLVVVVTMGLVVVMTIDNCDDDDGVGGSDDSGNGDEA